MRNATLITAGLLALGLTIAPPVEAQRLPGFGGVEGRVGVAVPDELDVGFGAAVDLDLGYILMPNLRPVIGFDYFQVGVSDRRFGTQTASGSLSAVGGRLGLRFDLSGMGVLQPYGIAALTGHNISVDGDTQAEQSDLDREFGGFVVGVSLGAGIAYALGETQRVRVVAEGRRVWNANVNHYAVDLGLRFMPLGARAYDVVEREPQDRAPTAGAEAAELRAERERVEAEQRRLERERDEAEQRRLERERTTEADAARRAEQDRRERLTEEERRQVEREAEEARREAARARQEAEAARAEAEGARQQARAAEERLYESLQDLNRLMANVTGIRDTERGLSIVLGQGLFGVGESDLSPRARDEVGRIAAVLAQYPQHQISVEGHTDATGSAEVNQRLSEQRANAVRAALVATGIDPARVRTVGHGPRLPIAGNETAAGRAQNRRVEIVVLGARRPGA